MLDLVGITILFTCLLSFIDKDSKPDGCRGVLPIQGELPIRLLAAAARIHGENKGGSLSQK